MVIVLKVRHGYLIIMSDKYISNKKHNKQLQHMTVRVMKKMTQTRHRLKHLSLCVITALAAQTTITQQAFAEEKAQEKDVERISVIGSHIKVNHDTGALPVTAMSSEDIENTGAVSGDELLSTIPAIGEVSFNSSRAAGGVNDARGDVSSINLRGIGSSYTLTLLNGRRLVLHPGTQAGTFGFVPVTTANSNALPVRGLKRLEVLRDGAAAIYGSDAVSGVINYVLKDDYEGSEVNLNYGSSEGTPLDQLNLSGSTGFYLNDERTHVSIAAGVYQRDGMMASDRSYAADSNLLNHSGVPEDFSGDLNFDNRSTLTAWGEFSSKKLGTFHLQPDTYSGCENSDSRGNPTTALDVAGVCVDRGTFTSSRDKDNRGIRLNRNAHRSLVSDVNRLNFYTLINHEINEDVELFAEASYYKAEAERTREQTANLTAQRFTISKDAYYNPFGENVTLRRYRPLDSGPRNIEVSDYSYRLLTGLRGYYNDWDWESAVLYSKANTLDSANRIDVHKFQNAVNSTDKATAYDVFNGGNLKDLTGGYAVGGSQAVFDSFMTTVERESETELALFDFKVSKADLFELPAGDVGFAAGIESRYESFSDVRSDILNTTVPFRDIVGNKTNPLSSGVLGSSPTPDAAGSRNVFSAYGEFAVPLLEGVPGVERLDMQLAARYERFSDVGDVLKPKVALSWIVNDMLQFRASYAAGFRAPGLPQVTAVNIARSNTRSDPGTNGRYGILEQRNGSDTLKPEESTNKSIGFVFEPLQSLTFTFDWWRINQEDVVGLVPSQSHVLYDNLLRVTTGKGNPLITRAIEDDGSLGEITSLKNDYLNLAGREIRGADISATYEMDTSVGEFKFKVNGARLYKFNQAADPISAIILAAQNSSNDTTREAVQYRGSNIAITGVGDLLRQNGLPKWRATASIDWKNENWSAGVRFKFVDDILDTSASYEIVRDAVKNAAGDIEVTTSIAGEDNTDNSLIPLPSGEKLGTVVDNSVTVGETREKVFNKLGSKITTDVRVAYKFTNEGLLNKTRVTFGVRNLTGQDPRLSDDSFGYASSVHSNRGRYFYLNINKKF